jgi:glycosyltransferase involved in cell wall biosynthesis
VKQDLPIRLFVDAHVFDKEFQGTRTFLKGIYAILAQKEHIRVYLAAFDTENLKRNFPASANIVYVKYRSRSPLIRLLIDIPAIIRRYKIDYAHFQYFTPLFKNCKQIVTIHDVIFKDYPKEFSLAYSVIRRMLFRRSALQSDIITTVSEYSKEAIKKYLGTGNRQVYVIPNGVHPRFFEPYKKTDSENYMREKYGFGKFILYVSRIEPRKNHVFLLKAWLDLELYRHGYHLVLLGHESIPVPLFDELLAAQPPDIRSRIFISSELKDEDLMQAYRAAAAFVYPSKAEGFGIPPLEAAALKTPVICSNTSAMKDFTFFGDNLIDPYDYNLFKQKLSGLLASPPGEDYLEEVARVVRREYTWEHSALKLYNLLF